MTDVILSADGLEVGLRPEVGGAFTHFVDRTGHSPTDLFLRAPPGFTDVLDSAGFALVPFCNRVREGRFRFGERQVALENNMPEEKHPQHGQGWRNPWTVAQADTASAELAYRHQPGDWPWAYDARMTVALKNRGMSVTLSVRNLSDETMPCGLGLHPYFPCNAHTILDASTQAVWTIDDEALPVERIPAEGRYALNQRLICGQNLDNAYEGWTGEATITWPDQGRAVRMTAQTQRLQIYSPARGGLIAAEPVTHANAALNQPQAEWRDLGLWLLEPGEARRISVQFDVLSL